MDIFEVPDVSRSLFILTTLLPLVLMTSCGGGGGSGGSGTNVPIVTTTTQLDLEGTVSGTNRVVANKMYSYAATAATGMVGNYTINWGDGEPAFNLAASSATRDKIWRNAGDYVASLSRTKLDGTVVTGSQNVAVVDRPVSAGLKHSCSIMSDNTVSCWGDNSKGQLGIGSLANTNAPSLAVGLSNVVSLSAFGNSTCAAKTDGSVWCWGYGLNATSGTAESVTTPQLKAGVTDVVALAGGNLHACALQRAGTVVCWGSNLQGEMGAGPVNDPSNVGINPKTPQLVVNLSDAVSIAAGGYTTCAIRADTSVWCWGGGVAGQAGPGVHNPSPISTHISFPVVIPNVTNAVSLSMNYTSSCAVLQDRSVKCWGANTGVTGNPLAESAVTVSSVGNAAAMSLGYSHACVLKADTSVACWGSYSHLGAAGPQSAPVAILDASNNPLTNVLAVTSGLDHSCALKEDGTVFCWGLDDKGQLGDGLNADRAAAAPVLAVSVGAAFTQAASQSIAVGGHHTCAIRVDGTVMCWGYNANGQLGDGSTVNSSTPIAVNIPGGVSAIAAGFYHTCAIKTDGSPICWGLNQQGQLGNGLTTNSATPVAVNITGGVTAISAGYDKTCAIRSGSGEVVCWGEYNTIITPTNIPGGAIAVSVGSNFVCAIKTNGSPICWGYNGNGELGNGTSTSSYVTPVGVNISGGVTALSASRGDHACAIKTNGDVTCWGAGSSGQLGNGQSNSYEVNPTLTSNGNGFASIASGNSNTCAIKAANGPLFCWGYNSNGSLGNGTNLSSNVPVAVNIAGSLTAIASGAQHSCALKADGSIMCWGFGMFGQLGNSAYTASNIPVPVQGITVLAAPARTFWR